MTTLNIISTAVLTIGCLALIFAPVLVEVVGNAKALRSRERLPEPPAPEGTTGEVEGLIYDRLYGYRGRNVERMPAVAPPVVVTAPPRRDAPEPLRAEGGPRKAA
jgi:hypothetical protein